MSTFSWALSMNWILLLLTLGLELLCQLSFINQVVSVWIDLIWETKRSKILLHQNISWFTKEWSLTILDGCKIDWWTTIARVLDVARCSLLLIAEADFFLLFFMLFLLFLLVVFLKSLLQSSFFNIPIIKEIKIVSFSYKSFSEHWNQLLIVWFLFEFQFSGVIQKVLELFWLTFT